VCPSLLFAVERTYDVEVVLGEDADVCVVASVAETSYTHWYNRINMTPGVVIIVSERVGRFDADEGARVEMAAYASTLSSLFFAACVGVPRAWCHLYSTDWPTIIYKYINTIVEPVRVCGWTPPMCVLVGLTASDVLTVGVFILSAASGCVGLARGVVGVVTYIRSRRRGVPGSQRLTEASQSLVA
jgi:hypothetical protein